MSIDRAALVRRHRVVVDAVDPRSPLGVGNGEMAMAVDVTGLQTFPELYPVTDPAGGPPGTLLGTQAQWAWHSVPVPEGVDVDLDRYRRPYATPRGEVRYVDAQPLSGSDDSALDAGALWLRANAHRLDLGRLGLVLPARDGLADEQADERADEHVDEHGDAYRSPSADDLGGCRQVLDPWTGTITSDVVLAGRHLQVTTACHPDRDVIAVRIERPPAAESAAAAGSGASGAPEDLGEPLDVAVRLAFPYGSQSWSNAADWTRPDAHATTLRTTSGGAVVDRRFDGEDDPTLRVVLRAPGATVVRSGPHELVVRPGEGTLDLVVAFVPGGHAPTDRPTTVPEPADLPTVDDVVADSAAGWAAFWRSGAALDLSGSTDPRAAEVERRAVLSQYLTAIHCAGSLPPQETGLLTNSWRGRFHLEMHWWHAAHFALWGRPALLERSMGWYERILPVARSTARTQGYRGARWPKQVDPDGRESPSDIGPFLLWQQPHVIHLAELLRRAGDPDRATARYGRLVAETAEFMADVAEPGPDGYSLGPPLIPAQESYASIRDRVVDPPFELAYWAWALGVAQAWRTRAGHAPEPRWDDVRRGLVRPLVRDGVLTAIGVPPYTIRTDHPSMVYGLGVVPATPLLDPGDVRATLDSVVADWDWPSTWGWDYPALAMTASRLHDPALAVDLLLRDEAKNLHLPNGHNRQTDHLPAYLPGNGGLLAALALMAGGWDGDGGGHAPGFPDDGSWVVRHEGFVRAP